MKKHTALYERISRKGQPEIYGLSIEHQKELLESFADKNGFTPFRHYTDIGISGTHFDRPSFQEMLREIQRGRVDAVIVADVSRFGRNYLESAHYTEELFPRYSVRFLSVLDDVDTFRDWEMEFLPFLHLIHDWFARETSRKGRQVVQLRQNSGLRGCNSAPFGTMPDPYDWNRLIPEPHSAPVVQQIFQWALEERSNSEIARLLREQHAPTPRDIQRLRNDPNHVISGQWTRSMVLNILRREVYTGTNVLNTHHTPVPGSHQTRPLPKEQHIRIPDIHVPLVSREDYDRVQEILPVRQSPFDYSHVPLQPWQDLLWHGIRQIPLLPRYNNGIIYWGDTSSDPTPRAHIRQSILLDILTEVLILLLRDGLSPDALSRLEQHLQQYKDEALQGRKTLECKVESRRQYYNHELKHAYERNSRQHRPLPEWPEPAPLPRLEERDRQLEEELRRLQAALDWCAGYTPETPLPVEEILPAYLDRVVLFPRDRCGPRFYAMPIHVTPAFSFPRIPPPGGILKSIEGDATGAYEMTVYPTRHVIHLIPKKDAPDLITFLTQRFRASGRELTKEALP